MKNAVKVVIDNLPKLKSSFAKLADQDVLVGVPKETTERKNDAAMNNATLAYIHDKGSPAAGIPARAFMEPGISNCKERLVNQFKSGARKALDGDNEAINNTLMKTGLIAQASIRNAINEGIPPPLAESTLKARIRNRTAAKGARAELQSRYEGNEPGMDLAKPLVATGQLRNSINFVIRKKT